MKKVYCLVLLCIFFIIFNFSIVYAVDINMNLSNNSSDGFDDNYSSENELTDFNDTDGNILTLKTNSYTTSSQKVSTTSTSDDDFHLTVSDIINIILIAVGIVIILLAIAILIRLK